MKRYLVLSYLNYEKEWGIECMAEIINGKVTIELLKKINDMQNLGFDLKITYEEREDTK